MDPRRAQPRFYLFPQLRPTLACCQDSPQMVIEPFLALKESSAFGATLQVDVDFLTGFGIQLRIEVGHDQVADFVALHNTDLLFARKMTCCIFLRARARFPITLPN